MTPWLIIPIIFIGSIIFWICFYKILFLLLDLEWKSCFKCKYPIRTSKAEKICKNCKKSGFKFKTQKQIRFEAWENKIETYKVEKIYNCKDSNNYFQKRISSLPTLGKPEKGTSIRFFPKTKFNPKLAEGYVKEYGDMYQVIDTYDQETYEEQEKYLDNGYQKMGYKLKTKLSDSLIKD